MITGTKISYLNNPKFMEKYNLDFSYTNYATIDENNKKRQIFQ